MTHFYYIHSVQTNILFFFSIQAYRKGKKEEEKKKNLQRRRLKLAQMLKAERDEYEVIKFFFFLDYRYAEDCI